MPSKRDYYDILGLGRSAGADEVKRAYRKLAIKFHPDNYRGDKTEGEAKFKELAEAYEVLSDPQKRQRYDQFGHAGLRGAGVHDFSSMGFGDIFSMFQDIFSGSGFGSGIRSDGRAGLDLETEVELTLEQVATGAEKTLEFERMDLCDACGGTGAKSGTQPAKCNTCGGYGRVQQQVSGFFGMSVRVVVCPECHGSGHFIREKCPRCAGTGRVRKKRALTVHIPPGIHDGQVVRVRNEGEPGRVGPNKGDLHVYVHVQPHPLLARRGDDLVCQAPVSFPIAALGGNVTVPTLTGPEEIHVPAGSPTGHILTLRKRGLPSVGGGRTGDLHVQIFVEVPKKLTKQQRELLGAYAETENDNLTPQRKSFMDALKDYFTDKKK